MAIKFGTNATDYIWGSNYNDQLFGLDGADRLFGRDGDDDLYGGGNYDWLDGGNGDDLLDGGGGPDSLVGGSGNDTAGYRGSPAGVFVSLYDKFAYFGDAEGDKLYSIENIWGSDFNDVLLGDDNANGLVGFGGNDVLWGGNGDDSLVGDMGTDMLFGNSGADTFWWTISAATTGVTRWTMDTVMDFNRSEGDLIDLSYVLIADGSQAFTFIGTNNFSGAPGEVRYYELAGNTYIEMQTDTSMDTDGAIRLLGLHTPDASWFVL